MKAILNLDGDFIPLSLGFHSNLLLSKQWVFNAGEVGINVNAKNIEFCTEIILTHRLNSSKAIIELLLVVDAIRRINPDIKLYLFIPYIPYARQDRVMTEGEPLSIAVFANLINLCNFKRVYYMTPHSDVSKALINNGVEVSDFEFIKTAISKEQKDNDYYICSPDAGALKRTLKTAYSLGYKKKVAIGSKVRDVSNGEILSTEVDVEDFEGKDVYIIDDICSGGRTFTELGLVIRQRNAGKLYLIITHFEKHQNAHNLPEVFDKVYYTDSLFNKSGFDEPYFVQIPINKLNTI